MTRLRRLRSAWPPSSGLDEHGLGVLSSEVCWQLLGESSVGRLGLRGTHFPAILPVNYVVRHDRIVFMSQAGRKVHAAHRGDAACFQIDHFDPLEHRGWSVTAEGHLEALDDSDLQMLPALPLLAWALHDEGAIARLHVVGLTGRVFGNI